MVFAGLHALSLGLLLCTAGSLVQAACNGHDELCSRKYSNVTFVGAHNSPFVGDLPQQNQGWDLTEQLNSGIRYLQGQTHKEPITNDLNFCHTSCFLEDAGKVEDWLKTLKTWLDANPNEVVTLLLTNGDSLPITTFGTAFDNSGLTTYAYKPSSTLALADWPTLQELIDTGTRLVVFLDYGADTSSVPYILDEFAYYFETPYDQTDSTFGQCRIDRPSGASATGRMYLVNHTLNVDIAGILIPDRLAAGTTNGATSIETQSALCAGLYGRWPNVVLLDYVDQGGLISAQEALNGL